MRGGGRSADFDPGFSALGAYRIKERRRDRKEDAEYAEVFLISQSLLSR